MNKTAFDIQNLIKTKEDANLLDSEIDFMLDSLFKNSKNFESLLFKKIRQSTFDAIKPELDKLSDRANIKEFLLNIKNKLEELKVIEISIAFEPTEELIENINTWIKENLGEKFIPDIKKDKTILGGAIIVFEGLYKDYSLKKALEETLKKKRQEIISLVK